jgi:nitroreductase
MLDKPARTHTPIHAPMAHRWSPRAFDRHKPVSREQLLSLLEAARWAPSCFNDQPWRYIVWDRHSNPDPWQQAFECLAEGNQAWVKNAPILMLAASDNAFGHNGKPNRWGQYDTGAASENICLQAAAMGLAAHQMGGFDVARLKTVFAIPEHIACMAMIAVGYQAPVEILEGELREKEKAERTRKALTENFFENGWGKKLGSY